ncbi:MAG: DUF3619 family protein [Rhodoferax sp.]|nr:DUF3619 family protein [Rhodoferax sp.]
MTKQLHHSGADLQDAVARAIRLHLDDGADAVPRDISERLKVARMQALSKRKRVEEAVRTNLVVDFGDQAALQMGSGLRSLLTQLGSWLPLLVLITGMLVFGVAQDEWTAQEIADVDAELLTDALPPAAYTDPGFVQFLRNNQEN